MDNYGSAVGNGYCPIVVDSNNTVHIAHTDLNESTVSQFPKYFVMYASWNGTSWSNQKVAEGFAYSLVLDANDHPHVLHGRSREPLMYASWTGTTWNSQTVSLNRSAYGPCYLAVDSSGNPHISCRQATPSQVIANIVYATATETAQPPAPTFPDSPLLLVSTAVIIGAVVTVVYVWKKKH